MWSGIEFDYINIQRLLRNQNTHPCQIFSKERINTGQMHKVLAHEWVVQKPMGNE